MVLHDLRHCPVEGAHRCVEATVGRGGDETRQAGRGFHLPHDVVEDGHHCRRQRGRFGAEVHPQQRMPKDFERQAHHRLVHVHPPPFRRFPGLDEPVRGCGDQRPEAGDALAVESRLDQAALAQPELAVAGQQASPGHRRQGVVLGGVLAVVARVVLQNALDRLRVIDQEGIQRADLEARHVTVAGGGVLEELQRVGAQGGQAAQ